MSGNIVIIDNACELQAIENQYPFLIGSPLILLSSNFSLQQLKSYENRGYMWFDELITNSDAEKMGKDIDCLLWSWFLGKNGEDLSEISGCSIGSAFAGSIEILLTTLFRYIVGLEKILRSDHIVYYVKNSEDIFLEVIGYIKSEIGFSTHAVENNNKQTQIVVGRKKQKIDADGRKRDLRALLLESNWKDKLLSKCISFITPRKQEQRVLLMSAGKMHSYFKYLTDGSFKNNFRWIIPIHSYKNVFNYGKSRPLFYHLTIQNKIYTDQIVLVNKIKDNIKKLELPINSQLLIDVFDKCVFIHFQSALNHYYSMISSFEFLRPDLVILSADSYENFLLAAQAAKKNGITTAFIPHGLYGNGFSEFKRGRFKVFDYSLSFSKNQYKQYILQGVCGSEIVELSHPYFERFLPVKGTSFTKYSSALILAPDKHNNSVAEKISSQYDFYQQVCCLLDDLGIKVVAIKARNISQFQCIGISKKTLSIGGKKIPLLSGYTSFPEAVKGIDLVIGPASTAVIEAGLLGVDYYVYQHCKFHRYTQSISHILFDIVNASFSMKQLKESILNRKNYKGDYSVYDLVNIAGLRDQQEIFDKFESGVQEILSSLESEKCNHNR